VKIVTQKLPFWKKDHLRANFHKCFPKGFMATQIHLLCANFVKFGRPEVGEIARCLPHKKIASLSRSRFCADRAQNLPGQRQTMYLQCPKFHPNPFTFGWRSYSRTREHRSNAPQSFPILGEAIASSPSN